MPAAEARRGALSDAEIDRLLDPLGDFDHIALAVSGGADSTALMVLAAGWAARRTASPRLSVLSVDHGLRPEAAAECAAVLATAAGLGLAAAGLAWAGDKPATGVQAAARAARYRLMSEWCIANGAHCLVTAHTADDQAETVLMRLARGSGLAGLAGIPARSVVAGIEVRRPLLAVGRERLVAGLTAAGLGWADDPANADPRFERARLRRAMPQLARLGLTRDALALSAARLARASAALDRDAEALWAAAVTPMPAGYFEVALGPYRAAADEVALRLLQRLAEGIGGDTPGLAQLERLHGWLAGDGGGRARTLAGCRFARRERVFLAGREPGRLQLEARALAPASVMVWDNRFRIARTPAGPGGPVEVVAAAASGCKRPPEVPDFAWRSMPLAIAGGEVVASPAAPGAAVSIAFVARADRTLSPCRRSWQ